MDTAKNQHRQIDVKKQRIMSLGETFGLCVKGVKHRLLRSVLTLAVVVLAVAFFMFLISESMFLRSTSRGVNGETRAERTATVLLAKFFSPATDHVTVNRLAEAWKNADSALLDEFARAGGMAREKLDPIAAVAREEVVYARWLESIQPGKRTVLIHKTHGREALDFIAADVEAFRENLAPMIDLRVPNGRESLFAFLAKYPAYKAELAELNKSWNEKVAAAAAAMDAFNRAGRASDLEWFAGAADADAESLRAQIEALGFAFTPAALATVRHQCLAAKETADVYNALNTREVKEAWRRAFQENKPTSPEQRIRRLTDKRAVEIFDGKFDQTQLERVESREKYMLRLTELERKLSSSIADDGGFLGLTGRQIFLLAISFVVCMVGISNAMLMAITERFREIATMKCLGATDSYILTQFMMEAAMQGFCGGLLGVLVGFAIATARGAIYYGAHLAAYWPWVDIGLSAVASLAAGVLLAVFASMQPSWSASRMAPMEAMRVE